MIHNLRLRCVYEPDVAQFEEGRVEQGGHRNLARARQNRRLLRSVRRCSSRRRFRKLLRDIPFIIGVRSALTGSLIEMAILEPNSWLITRIVTWIETITPSCEDITHLLSQSMDGRLLLHHRFFTWIHLTICDRCGLNGQHLAFIRKVRPRPPGNGQRISEVSLSENARQRNREAHHAENP
jgi:hypothetical protein